MFLDVPADYTDTQINVQPFDHEIVISKSINLIDYTPTTMDMSNAEWGYTSERKSFRIPAPYALKKAMFKMSSKAISKALK